MSQIHDINRTLDTGGGSCPIDHSLPRQKTNQVVELSGPPIERDNQGMWHIRGFEEARAILRNKDTRQAGFNADQIEGIRGINNQPILYLEGKTHQQQRIQTARFFTPKTVSTSYRQFIEKLSDQLVEQVRTKKTVDLSQLSLMLAVQVASRVVGLTNSLLPGMDKRLDVFFHMDHNPVSRYPLLRWKLFARLLGLIHQRHVLSFFFLDVQPAIRARRRHLQEDVISHLIGLKYSDAEILTECLTYAAAGMVTTREFISLATWHMLEHPSLRTRYLSASEEERFEILHEALRLEPVVSHLYRHATADIQLESQEQHITIPAGSLIDIHIYATNADESVVGAEPLALCPNRQLHGDRVPTMLMGFGDGAHRCPGSFLAIQETDIFLQRLLALDHLRIEHPPKLSWNEVSTGYEIRDFLLTCEPGNK